MYPCSYCLEYDKDSCRHISSGKCKNCHGTKINVWTKEVCHSFKILCDGTCWVCKGEKWREEGRAREWSAYKPCTKGSYGTYARQR